MIGGEGVEQNPDVCTRRKQVMKFSILF